MRKALNVLQPCQAAVTGDGEEEGKEITEEIIYDCVGSPQPADIQAMLDLVLKNDWTTAARSLTALKTAKGLALADILDGIVAEFESYDLTAEARIHLLEGLSEIEYRLAGGGNEKIHTSAAIGVVKSTLEVQGRA